MYNQTNYNQQNNAQKEKKKSVGGIWSKKSKSGKPYYSISIEVNGQVMRFVGFVNDRKGNEKAPDVTIYTSEPQENKMPF